MPKGRIGSNILEGYRAGVEGLFIGQIDAWQRFWQHVESEDYTFGKAASDMGRYWGHWMFSMANLAMVPVRPRDTNDIPTVAFVLDNIGSVADPQTVANARLKAGVAASATAWTCTDTTVAEHLSKLTVDVVPDASYGTLEVRLDGVKEFQDSIHQWRAATATAMICQERTPLARLVVVLK